ncbi:MAG TPA: hypothetical protein VMI56_14120 [Reyranella sp.]|nr:hypothetical protein [Reyranella sp.]
MGWLLLALAIAAVVNDCLGWWSEGVFRLLSLGDLWTRVHLGSLQSTQAFLSSHARGLLWFWFLMPILRLPALPVLTMAGVILLWIGRRSGTRAEGGFVIGSKPPRRRRGRSGIT